jgi:hypothetical protein
MDPARVWSLLAELSAHEAHARVAPMGATAAATAAAASAAGR